MTRIGLTEFIAQWRRLTGGQWSPSTMTATVRLCYADFPRLVQQTGGRFCFVPEIQ